MPATKSGEYTESKVNLACLRLFLRSSTGPNRAFEARSLGRVRDPFRIAEGPNAFDSATQRRHFGFRLRLVDKLQPIGGVSGRVHPLSGTWENWMAPNVVFRTILDLAAERIAQQLGEGGVSVLRSQTNLTSLPDSLRLPLQCYWRLDPNSAGTPRAG